MYFKNPSKNWLLAISMILLLNSCQEEENPLLVTDENINAIRELESGFSLQELTGETLNFRLGNWNMIYEETFEGPDPFYCYSFKQFPESHSFSKSSNPVFRGNSSGKFDLRYGDRHVTSSGVRSEVLFSRPTNPDAWYSFAVYFPSDYWQTDRDHEIFSQWHSTGDPTLSFRIHDGRLIFRVGNSTKNWHHYDFGPVPKSQWIDFVFHIIHSKESTGLVEIWRNGNKILTHNGPNRYANEDQLPRWKVGIYKWSWDNGPTNVNRRVIYFDNIRIGNENSELNEMRPSSENTKGWGPYIPEIMDFTGIHTRTKNELGKLPNNGKINLGNLGSWPWITIRANFEENFQGSVRFELAGTKPHTRNMNFAPYVLYGINNNGSPDWEYGYNGGTPVGDYQLTATPYAEVGAKGKRGNPVILNFKVVDEEGLPENPGPTNEIGLVGFWKMDKSGDKLLDESGFENHGDVFSSSRVSWVTGKNGQAVRFNENFATIPYHTSLNVAKDITISAWIRPTVKANRRVFSIGGTDGFNLMIKSNGKLDFRFNTSSNGSLYSLESSKSYPNDGNTWMHVTATFDGNTSRIYINGVLDSSKSFGTIQAKSTSSSLQIGAFNNINRWSGDLDEVRLYNRVLSASEISNLMQ